MINLTLVDLDFQVDRLKNYLTEAKSYHDVTSSF